MESIIKEIATQVPVATILAVGIGFIVKLFMEALDKIVRRFNETQDAQSKEHLKAREETREVLRECNQVLGEVKHQLAECMKTTQCHVRANDN